MTSIPAELRRMAADRAGDCCEYCRLPQRWQEATFHIDHILPRIDGGTTTDDNLALAGVSCSLRKAARVVAVDRDTGLYVALYHLRLQSW